MFQVLSDYVICSRPNDVGSLERTNQFRLNCIYFSVSDNCKWYSKNYVVLYQLYTQSTNTDIWAILPAFQYVYAVHHRTEITVKICNLLRFRFSIFSFKLQLAVVRNHTTAE